MTALLCPVCSESHFDNLDALRNRLVRAATHNIPCPICDQVLLGLDKLTIHLFGHSLPSEPQQDVQVQTPSTVNMDDLSFLTSWSSHRRNAELEDNGNIPNNIYLEIKTPPQTFSNVFLTKSPEILTKNLGNRSLNFSSPIEIQSLQTSEPNQPIFQNQSFPYENVEKSIDPNFIHKPQNRSFSLNGSNDVSCQTECTPHTPNLSSLPVLLSGETAFPAPSYIKDEDRPPSSEDLSQYMAGLLKLEHRPSTPIKKLNIFENQLEGLKSHLQKVANNRKYIIDHSSSELGQGFADLTRQQCDTDKVEIPELSYESTNKSTEDGRQENLEGFHFLSEQPTTTLGSKNQIVEEDQETTKEDHHSCRECGKSFRMRGSLIVHARVAHAGRGIDLLTEPRNFHCTVCSKSFKKEQHLGQHMKTHDGKQWQCETCAKYFTTKYFLKKHQRLHTGEMPYCCETCGKAFTFQQSYHKHLLYHSSDKPHECKECGRSFKELSTLHNHQRIHSGEKPFACETCGKCFRQRVSYIVHQRIHTGVLPYQCTACYKKFRYKVSQRSHKCTAQPPGVVIRQPGDLIQRLLQQRSLLQCE